MIRSYCILLLHQWFFALLISGLTISHPIFLMVPLSFSMIDVLDNVFETPCSHTLCCNQTLRCCIVRALLSCEHLEAERDGGREELRLTERCSVARVTAARGQVRMERRRWEARGSW